MHGVSLIFLPIFVGMIFTNDQLHFTRRLVGRTMTTVLAESVHACYKECRLSADCHSLNYNRRFTLCELNNYAINGTQNVTFDQDFDKVESWVFFNVAQNANGGLEQCNVITCPDENGCRRRSCVTKHCEPTANINVPRGVVYGNMNYVGSRIRIVCDAGYYIIGADVSECKSDGNWSSLPTCETKCPVPLKLQNVEGYPTIMSANIHSVGGLLTNVNMINNNTVVLEGSDVTFSCAAGTYLQSDQRVFCHAGQWIYMPGCEEMGLGIDCLVNSSCSIQPHSNECVNPICRCPLGTSYSYNKSRCIEKCPNGYANTFNEVNGVGQFGDYNIETFLATRGQCEEKCLDRSDYICRSFDYDYSRGYCFLQSVTYFDDPPSVGAWPGGAYFLRDCLNWFQCHAEKET